MKSKSNRKRADTRNSVNTGTTIESKKPNTKQELIAANIKLLIEQLGAGHSEGLTNYTTAMSRFTITALGTCWRSRGR